MNKRVILRASTDAYESVCFYLRSSLNFDDIHIIQGKEKSIKSKKEHFISAVRISIGLLKQINKIKKYKIIMSMDNYASIWMLFFNKIKIIHPEKILWWSFFVHSEKAQKMMKILLKALYKPNVKLILFSECETNIYKERLELPERVFVSIPYGDWSNCSTYLPDPDMESGDYYFSGGYSNRDYAKLLDGWEQFLPDKKLVIIGSVNNKDLVEFNKRYHGENIKIMFDLDTEEFERYLSNAKACILPFKLNTGASGQSVTLRCMRNNILVISKDTDVMREYVDNGKTGYLIRSYGSELESVINLIEKDNAKKYLMLCEQHELYIKKFSYPVITNRLNDMIINIS